MYGYIYDIFVSQKKYQRELVRIENSITDLGMQGHVVRLSLISNVSHAIEDLLSRGVRTIVAVGSDQLLSKIADYADLLQNTAVAVIPIGSHHLLADLFGVPYGSDACKTLSARMIKHIRLGRINRSYFIHSVAVRDSRTRVRCDDQFVAKATSEDALISILKTHEAEEESLPLEDQKLSVFLTPATPKSLFKKSLPVPSTFIRCQLAEITEPKQLLLVVDGQKQMKTPAIMHVSPTMMKIVVGKGRKI
jgi:hypothetical protein